MHRGPLAIVVVVVLVFGARAVGAAGGGPGELPAISEEQRAAALTMLPTVAPADRAWITAAIAHARPEAQRLIREVDGLTTLSTVPKLDVAMGVTHVHRRGDEARFAIELDLASLNGRRTIDRETVVLHELGHVIDFALVPEDVNARLEAGIPRTGTCGHDAVGTFGSCTEPAERFADTFAKWALRGRVSVVGAGYGVATPPSLEDWGAPLVALSTQLR